MSKESVLDIYRNNSNSELILIGGEPMILGADYYNWLLDSGVTFSMQTNLTLYDSSWDRMLSHKNFTGLSVSGDKFGSIDEFLVKYNIIRDTHGITPLVLILMTGENREQILNKCTLWIDAAVKYRFPLKINYVIPVGRALNNLDMVPRLSVVYDIFSLLLEKWRDLNFPPIDPFHDLMNSIILGEGSVCSNIPGCLRSGGVLSFEPNGDKYWCPLLGDLKIKREDVIVNSSEECLLCGLYQNCQLCAKTWWMLSRVPDPDYCESFKSFNRRLYSLQGDYCSGI